MLEHFENLTDTHGGFSLPNVWGLRKKVCPKLSSDVPSAMMDSHKNLITKKTGLVQLYENTYKERLTAKPIRTGREDIKEMKEMLFSLRVEKSSLVKTGL